MRTTWISIVACASLLCWAAQTPRVSALGKPPPPPCCYEPPPDAEDQDAASEIDGGPDAATIDSGGGAATPGAAERTTADAATALDSGEVDGRGCNLVAKRPGPVGCVVGLAFAALIALRRRGRILTHR